MIIEVDEEITDESFLDLISNNIDFPLITELIASDSQLTSVPLLPKLQYLYIDGSKTIKSIPVIDTLIVLDCSDTNITSIPKLNNLKELVCNNCKYLNKIPKLSNLNDLECSGSNIIKIPKLKKLVRLSCSFCPNLVEITNLPNLNVLECNRSKNLLKISLLPKLIKFECDDCEKLSEISFLPNIYHLKIQNCSNLIRISHMKNLIELCFCYYRRVSLSNIPNLKILNNRILSNLISDLIYNNDDWIIEYFILKIIKRLLFYSKLNNDVISIILFLLDDKEE